MIYLKKKIESQHLKFPDEMKFLDEVNFFSQEKSFAKIHFKKEKVWMD